MNTEREQILALANDLRQDCLTEAAFVEAFYHAARKPIGDELEQWQRGVGEILSTIPIGKVIRASGSFADSIEYFKNLHQQLAAANARISELEGQGEPVAWVSYDDKWHLNGLFERCGEGRCPLYLRAPQAVPEVSVGWLVENGKHGDELRYRVWKDGLPEWTADPNDATRYCRRIDAENVHREDEDAWRIVEHAWIDCRAAAPSPEGEK